jgi:hypothetical protein
VLTPKDVDLFGRRPYYSFAGTGTVRPLLAGVVRNLASPEGSADGWPMLLAGFYDRIAA